MPDKESLHRVEMNLQAVGGDLRVLGEAMKSVREIAVMTRDMIAREAR